jgi:hypothetical protein
LLLIFLLQGQVAASVSRCTYRYRFSKVFQQDGDFIFLPSKYDFIAIIKAWRRCVTFEIYNNTSVSAAAAGSPSP